MFAEKYPVENAEALKLDETEYAVQVNSKIVCKAMLSSDASNEEIEEAALALSEVAAKIEGKTVKKCIVVKGHLVNLIVG